MKIADIQRIVADQYGLTVDQFKSDKRARLIARPRQVAMQLCHDLTDASYPMIGRAFGGRDHTTVMHAIRKVAELRRADRRFAEKYDAVRMSVQVELS